MNRISASIIVALVAAIGAAQTQAGTTPVAAAPVTSEMMQESSVRTFWESATKITSAQAILADALGQKVEADKLHAEVALLQGGATEGRSAIERNVSLTTETNKVIQEKMASGVVVDAAGKAKFVSALSTYAGGLLRARSMPMDLRTFASSAQAEMTSGNLLSRGLMARKLTTGLFLAKQTPGYLKSAGTTFGQMMAFAKKNGIKPSKDADAATKVLGDFGV